jgi:glycosyltransferase involved in cell wall biosynthesis
MNGGPVPLYSIEVIIPAYNPGFFFQQCLDSCLFQTFKGSYSITIVDDGSSEDLYSTLSKFRPYPANVNIHYIRLDENKGAAHARNVGIKNTAADLIVFHDADDFMCQDRLEATVKAFDEDPVLVMVCGNWRWIIDGQLEDTPRFSKEHPIEYITLLFDLPICSATVAIKKEILNTTGLFNESYVVAEDYDLWARIVKNYPDRVKYIHREMIHHNRHATPYSLTKRYMWTEQHLQIIEEMKKKYKMI